MGAGFTRLRLRAALILPYHHLALYGGFGLRPEIQKLNHSSRTRKLERDVGENSGGVEISPKP